MNALDVLAGVILVAFLAGSAAVASIELDAWRSRRRFTRTAEAQRRVSLASAPTQAVRQ